MRKLFWFAILALIIGILILFFRNKKLKEETNEIPLQEKYEGFQEINENYKSDIFQVKLLCESYLKTPSSTHPIRIFPSLNKNLIIECDVAKDEKTRINTDYYKINEHGEIKDLFHFQFNRYWPNFINEFIVFTNDDGGYYNTWPLNGDRTHHKMTELNDDFSWTAAKVNDEIAKIKKESSYYFIQFDNIRNYTQHFFYQDSTWKILWQKMPGYTQYGDDEKVYRYRNDVFKTGNADSYLSQNIEFLHFYPEQKITYHHSIGGGMGGSSTVYNWRGKGFFQTKIGNRDFQYSIPKLVLERENFDGMKNRFYTVTENKAGSHILENSFYSNCEDFAFYTNATKKLYLIRVKK